MDKLVPALLALGLSAAAQAAVPAALGKPSANPVASISVIVTVPGMPRIVPMSFPGVQAPSINPMRFPGVPSPLPLPVPAALLASRRPAPSTGENFIDWSFLDGNKDDDDGLAPALVPVDRGPKPLPPSGAIAELRDAIFGREPIRMKVHKSDALFDGRGSARELELPYGKHL